MAGDVAVLRLVAGWLGRLISASMFEKVFCMQWRRMYRYLWSDVLVESREQKRE